ncbi:hypothetical protein QYM36_007687 [Artemia franciscana]|uniref:Uncharacterized protein n=1 Tax=Artemia franciscana TaxID=6661 RepID=A0AA88IGP4_ARTSF|nr:hypothetical protein QYM36_007687 [Artemia franciscana]
MIINPVVKPGHSHPPLPTRLKLDRKDIDKEDEIKREYTPYFASIGCLAANSVSEPRSNGDFTIYLCPPCHKSFVIEQVTETEVSWKLSALKGPSSSGSDLLPTRVVKTILPAIVTPLT